VADTWTPREVRWSGRARDYMKRLPEPQRRRVFHEVEGYAHTGAGNVRPLKGRWSGLFRLRVGQWRVVFALSPDTLTVVDVGPRGDVYRP
jgi:mRNA interferase RelE/StbE